MKAINLQGHGLWEMYVNNAGAYVVVMAVEEN